MRNVSERVIRVIVAFAQEAQHLSVIYISDGVPSADDWEDCELTCGELIAEFPEIKSAETACVRAVDHSVGENDHEIVVFLRE
jgi:hypothetical protein